MHLFKYENSMAKNIKQKFYVTKKVITLQYVKCYACIYVTINNK